MSGRTIWFLGFTTVVLLMMVALAAARGVAASPQQATTAEVKIDNFSFGPATLTIAPGTTVTWVNHDDIPHTLRSTHSVFKSKLLDTHHKFSFTFTTPTPYPNFCPIPPKL